MQTATGPIRSTKGASARRTATSFLAVLGFASFIPAAAALAQTSVNEEFAAQASGSQASLRAVGREGRLSRVNWRAASMRDLRDMRLEGALTQLSKTPGVLRHTKFWVARADVCAAAGEEILVQIRSPLTCGSLGCEMTVISDAGPIPRVMLRTVGDTIDAPAIDELIVNAGAPRQRAFKYSAGRFQQQ